MLHLTPTPAVWFITVEERTHEALTRTHVAYTRIYIYIINLQRYICIISLIFYQLSGVRGPGSLTGYNGLTVGAR